MDYLARIVGHPGSGQWGFHARSAERSQLIFNRLRSTTLGLLGLTCLGVGARLFLLLDPGGERWLLLASGVLPALGAALEGINNQGEFARTAHRSAVMAGAFQAYAAQVRRLREKDAPLAPVTALSSQITQTMVDEITDWPFFPTALSESR